MEQWLNKLFMDAVELNASDLHLTVGIPPVMRRNGSLHRYGENPITSVQTKACVKSMVTEKEWNQFQEKGEIDFSYRLEGMGRFRVNVFRQQADISLAVRVIPASIPSIHDLGLPEILKEVVNLPQGLILITGPTGSGKSTTLASMIHFLNQTSSKHIITLEDPIEYVYHPKGCVINQREVGKDTQSFASGLRAALRQDPDVILVGEMRDLETIATAITAAETGHLILGTLHTSDAASSVDRIIDVFPPDQQTQIRYQLAEVLVMILSQRLINTVNQNGRRAACEVLIRNTAVANLIRNEKTYQIPSIMQTSSTYGMQTLDMSLKGLVEQGVITRETAKLYLREKEY